MKNDPQRHAQIKEAMKDFTPTLQAHLDAPDTLRGDFEAAIHQAAESRRLK